MDLYFNDAKISTIEITSLTTIGQVKQMVSFALPKNVTNYTISLLFSDGTALTKEVFAVDTYNGANFKTYASFLNGGQIQVYSAVTPITAIKFKNSI
ncbi:unnamed protein product [marine sediment metagenome]|uniref:Uncharacterized protein n=1 Tax=marine sediment metagenome TaxID=412755 RepID=X1D5U4_9ZZZZ